jgi:hypothetical protein
VRLNELYRRYKDQVEFFVIYIREAHPAQGWQVPNNVIENIIVEEPRTDQERTEVAATCRLALGLEMPMLIDSIQNSIDEDYVGLPMRQFLIDAKGRVVYRGEKGPFGWNDVEFERALRAILV